MEGLDVQARDRNPRVDSPVVAMDFSKTSGSTILAYGLSYDWANGYRGSLSGSPSRIMLHACKVRSTFHREYSFSYCEYSWLTSSLRTKRYRKNQKPKGADSDRQSGGALPSDTFIKWWLTHKEVVYRAST
jgi:hypothetical protein